MKNAHRGLSTRPGTLLALRSRSPCPEELQSCRAAMRASESRVQACHHTLSDHHRLFCGQSWPRWNVPGLQPSDPVSGPEGLSWRFSLEIYQIWLSFAEGIWATSVRPYCLPKSLPRPFMWPGTCCPCAR